MGLFDKIFQKDMLLSVEDAKGRLISSLAMYTGWKYLKSTQCLKKTIGRVVFEIILFSSKYNQSFESVEINCEFRFWNKTLDKHCSVKSSLGFCTFQPDDAYWYDISSEKKLMTVTEEIKKKIDRYVFPLVDLFERDFDAAICELQREDLQTIYHFKMP